MKVQELLTQEFGSLLDEDAESLAFNKLWYRVNQIMAKRQDDLMKEAAKSDGSIMANEDRYYLQERIFLDVANCVGGILTEEEMESCFSQQDIMEDGDPVVTAMHELSRALGDRVWSREVEKEKEQLARKEAP
jgi:hypothetical protein